MSTLVQLLVEPPRVETIKAPVAAQSVRRLIVRLSAHPISPLVVRYNAIILVLYL